MRANPKMAKFLTVAAKHCRQAEHSLQLAAGSFNILLEMKPPVALGDVIGRGP